MPAENRLIWAGTSWLTHNATRQTRAKLIGPNGGDFLKTGSLGDGVGGGGQAAP